MQIRFARYLYVPAPGRVSVTMSHQMREVLRETGFAEGPTGEGEERKPFRPAGPFATYAESLGLQNPTLTITWSEHPEPVRDTLLPQNVAWSRCPNCAKLIPTDGSVIEHPMTGEPFVVPIEMCISCGVAVDCSWASSDSDIVFSSAFFISLVADHFGHTQPTIHDALPELVDTISAVLDHSVREVFVAL